MSLTNEQIETLFAFTKTKSVQYYDLQVELVDHLASSIEEEMEADRKLTFDNALQKVYSRFGLFGFAHVVQERERALEKQHKKLWRQTLTSYFILPRIAFTAFLFVMSSLILIHVPVLVAEIMLWATLIICGAVAIRRNFRYRKTIRKPLLLTQFAPNIPYAPVIVAIVPGIAASSHKASMVIVAIIIVGCILFQVALGQISNQIRQKAKELYPEAFSVA